MKYLVLLLTSVLCIPVLAQNWKADKSTDPMTDKTYSMFVLQGKGVEEDMSTGIAVYCADNKIANAKFAVQGKTFHYDGFATASFSDLRRGPYTHIKVKMGKKLDTKILFTSDDQAQIIMNHKELAGC